MKIEISQRIWEFGDCQDRGPGGRLLVNSGNCVVCRGVVKSNFINICLFVLFEGVLVLMDLVGRLRFHNEYGEFETVNPGDRAELLLGAVLESLGAGVVSVVYFLAIFFMFSG